MMVLLMSAKRAQYRHASRQNRPKLNKLHFHIRWKQQEARPNKVSVAIFDLSTDG